MRLLIFLSAAVAQCLSNHASPASFLERPPATALYRRADAPVNARVADLLSRMTLEEKVAQLLNPWPTAFNCADLLRLYSNTSVGAVYAYSISNCSLGLQHIDALNYFQGMLVNHSRLGIPVATITESLHSSVQGGTAFPNPTLLGQTWSPSLIQRIGAAIGGEARANGITRGFAPVLQVVTDGRFGRYEESYGEDPLLVGYMGSAMVKGQQGTGGPSVYLEDTSHISCEAKHAVAYAAGGRDWYRADVSQRTLMDVYVRPWRSAIEAGLRGLMVSHPEVSGLPMHGNGPILSGILRGVLGGAELFFSSDAGDVEAIASHGLTTSPAESAIYALTAGLDQELVTTCYPTLVDSVQRGLVDVKYVDAAVTRVLREKVALHLLDGPQWWYVDPAAAAAALVAPANRALAREAAAAGIVLLRNAPPAGASTPILPLAGLGTSIKRVAIVGPNAGCAMNATDCAASSAYRGGYSNSGAQVVTLLDALNALPGLTSVVFAEGANATDATDESGIPAALAAAAAAEVVIAVVGDTSSGFGKGTCAEGIDADDIDLPGSQLALLAALAAGPTPLVVVGIHGRPFTLGAGPTSRFGANNGLLEHIPALLAAFRPGEEGGNAILDLLTGAVNPSGRLTAGWVRHVGALRSPANPYFQARGAPTKAYVTEPANALFPFGSGMSYSTFTITAATLEGLPPKGQPAAPLPPNGTLTIAGSVSSKGPAGAVILQLYFSQDAPTKWVRTSSQLLGFARIEVPADAVNIPFSFNVDIRDMDVWDEEVAAYVVHKGAYSFALGLDSVEATTTSKFKWEAIPVDGVAWTRPSFPGAPARVEVGVR